MNDVEQAVAGCTCARLRHAARRTTQFYDGYLAATGLTVGQFGLLARLRAAGDGVTMGALAQLCGMDPTTLKRNLKPLVTEQLVAVAAGADRRARVVLLTPTGAARLLAAKPRWREAQDAFAAQFGDDTVAALNGLLDRVRTFAAPR